jgi:hypothetical protein
MYIGGCQMSWKGKYLDVDFVSALTASSFPGPTFNLWGLVHEICNSGHGVHNIE